ncbi:hypothetical protein [Petrachloros mirabilis]
MSGVLVWATGILASIITALTVWWLTHPGGPLNPISESEGPAAAPNVLITDFHIGPVRAGQVTWAKLNAHNKGGAVAQDCQIIWHPTGGKFEHNASKTTSVFPEEARSFALKVAYAQPGVYHAFAIVFCTNFTSPRYEKIVRVDPAP